MKNIWNVAAAAVLATACGALPQTSTNAITVGARPAPPKPVVHATVNSVGAKISAIPGSALKTAAAGTNGIDYHGGPVMLGQIHAYFIWYGNWEGNTATSILTDWANTIGGSPLFGTNSTYTDAQGNAVRNDVQLMGSTTDSYSHGSSLSQADVFAVVSKAIAEGRLPEDGSAVYFVLTSSDVAQPQGENSPGFCSAYCGWHTYGYGPQGTSLKYAFIGNPDRCPGTCDTQSTSPNGNAGADGMATIMTHELEESASDPQISAWYANSNGQENGDKCAWNFGNTYKAPNGSTANVHLGNRDFLIQQNWVNANGGFCGLSFDAPAPAAGLSAQYFAAPDLTNLVLTRVDGQVGFDWGGGSPDPLVPSTNFSARWHGVVIPTLTEPYTFTTVSDDGVRLWVDGNLLIDNWTPHAPTSNSATVQLIGGQSHELRMEYNQYYGGDVAQLYWQSAHTPYALIPSEQLYPVPFAPTQGLTAQYFKDQNLSSLFLTTVDAQVDFDWQGRAPYAQMPATNFSVRWMGQVTSPVAGAVTFVTQSDDGVRLWVNEQLVVDNWTDHAPTQNQGVVQMFAGKPMNIRMEYYQNQGGDVARLQWILPSEQPKTPGRAAGTAQPVAIPSIYLTPQH